MTLYEGTIINAAVGHTKAVTDLVYFICPLEKDYKRKSAIFKTELLAHLEGKHHKDNKEHHRYNNQVVDTIKTCHKGE